MGRVHPRVGYTLEPQVGIKPRTDVRTTNHDSRCTAAIENCIDQPPPDSETLNIRLDGQIAQVTEDYPVGENACDPYKMLAFPCRENE